jgi:hypothetical protein
MARIPEPVPGLIFRCGYLWLREFRQGRTDPTKDRPACIIIRVAEGADPGLHVTGARAARIQPGDIVILPITTQRPPPDQFAIELSPDEKRLCRLDPAAPSWVIVSEFNADIWPNADLSLVSRIAKLQVDDIRALDELAARDKGLAEQTGTRQPCQLRWLPDDLRHDRHAGIVDTTGIKA